MTSGGPLLTTPLETWTPEELQQLVAVANQMYFRTGAWNTTTWMGRPVIKCPNDLWTYQEILAQLRPDVLVETGTYMGGSALFFADVMERLGHGRVVTVDVESRPDLPEHARISYLTGNSTDEAVVGQVIDACRDASTVMVILDSSHRAEHVAAEITCYAPLVTPGSYLVVEDTAFDGWPAWPAFGAGPASAVEAFVGATDEFEVQHHATRHLISLVPGGFLRRRNAPKTRS